MTTPASTMDRDLRSLSLADRWRLIRWIAERYPAVVTAGLASLPSMRKSDVTVLSWVLREPEEQPAEDLAG